MKKKQMCRSFNKSQQKLQDFIHEEDNIIGGEVNISQIASDFIPV